MEPVTVGIVGSGIAGLTAALRLAERGFEVTVYEAKPYIGGKLGAHSHVEHPERPGQPLHHLGHPVYHEHAFHMFLNWYHNFWRLVADVGLSRERHFEPRDVTQYLRRGAPRRMVALGSPGSPRWLVSNMFAGVYPPADVFLAAYALVDLLGQSFDPARLGDTYTVNGFLQSRPYTSEASAAMHRDLLVKAFAIPSYLTSARSYQSFMKYGFVEPEPLLWVLRGDCQRHLNAQIAGRLAQLGVRIETSRRVTWLELDPQPPTAVVRDARVAALRAGTMARDDSAPVTVDRIQLHLASVSTDLGCLLGSTDSSTGHIHPTPPMRDEEDVAPVWHQYVILALPPAAVVRLIRRSNEAGKGFPVRFAPLPKLRSEPMASLDLYFGRALPGMPREHVVLVDSAYGLSLVDQSQTWPELGATAGGPPTPTVLNVVAADFRAPAEIRPEAAVYDIVQDLRRYVPFDFPGDLDLARCHFQTNVGDELFVNEVGSEQWRPEAVTVVSNLFLAGDYCKTVIDVVCVEGAVVSGLLAARAVQDRARADGRAAPAHLAPIEIVEPASYSEAQMTMLKLALAPYAAAARAWSSLGWES